MTNKEIDKIGKILSDTGKSKMKEFDIVFLIDATGSMSSYIEAAKSTAEILSQSLRQKFPDTNFQYGYIFYRDPIDSYGDIHEIIYLSDDVNSIVKIIGLIEAYGGGDMPEDWAGAYKKVNEEIKWRNGTKVIFHLADAGAHGRLFTYDDKYPEEEQKLINELEICCEKKIKIFGFVIDENSRNTFEKCKDIYRKKGGFYEIYNFEKPKGLCSQGSSLFAGKRTTGIGCSLFASEGSKSIFKEEKNIFKKNDESEKINKTTSLFGNLGSDFYKNKSEKSLFGNNIENNKNTNGLFVNNDNSKSLFGNNKDNHNKSNSLFATNKEINNDTNSLFGNNKANNKNTNSLFGNNNNSNSLFGNNKENNNNTNSLFGNNNSNNLFATNKKNNNDTNIFGNFKGSNKDTSSLFGNHKESNNDTNSLLGNNKENNNDTSSLFGKNKENNNQGGMSYQSTINKSFFNLVFDSIQNINKSENNLFNNINN